MGHPNPLVDLQEGWGQPLNYAMNNHGRVVGQSFLTGDQANHPFLLDRGTGLSGLDTLGGNFGSANAVNEDGEAVGWGNFAGDASFHAVLWTSIGQVTEVESLASHPFRKVHGKDGASPIR